MEFKAVSDLFMKNADLSISVDRQTHDIVLEFYTPVQQGFEMTCRQVALYRITRDFRAVPPYVVAEARVMPQETPALLARSDLLLHGDSLPAQGWHITITGGVQVEIVCFQLEMISTL